MMSYIIKHHFRKKKLYGFCYSEIVHCMHFYITSSLRKEPAAPSDENFHLLIF